MRFNKLDLNLLVALDMLLSEASISRAAEQLHMSQPAMSNALSRLRTYFEDELLVQVGRRMELTPRAEMLKDAVRDVLVRIDSSITAQPEFVPATSNREFRIFVSDFTLSTLMPYVLARAYAQGPRIRFSLLPQVEEPTRSLERAEVDMLVMPSNFCTPEHPTENLFSERFQCLVWEQSPLAHGALSVDRYLAAGHVEMRPPAINASSLEAQLFTREGLSRRVDVTCFSFASAPALIVGTDRIATVHGRLAKQATARYPVVIREAPLELPPMNQVLQWHCYRTNDPGIAWLRGIFHSAVLDMDRKIADN
ncbi:LysR family transcriptional regulator [Comamonas testosteroni]|uniref:LysR family transcriptional regulator n=1 Tax=Comamonas testosteroni TaxID=285 RepID=UPI0023AA9E3E|nr:LysR family transcriptional regulator [Comamonas testosteroni]WEE79795.1 LysR family transcriptional regulator [Comamonas testosteroni]